MSKKLRFSFDCFNSYEIYSSQNRSRYWGKAGAGVLLFARTTSRFLILLRSTNLSREPHTWGIVGGKIESGEKYYEATIRELCEETKFCPNPEEIVLILAYIFEAPTDNFKFYDFIGIIEDEFEPILNWENDDYKWVTLDELKNPRKFNLKLHFGLDLLIKSRIKFLEEIVREQGVI